ncbi:MAG: hypothetical protein CL942_08460 [Desulfovibrio sp.]|nr:hypothetical protein [Desulfovibrio sp.]|tara:strand:+ start:433 stop:786 length:354 start_codon:yes stop_codon:yes gene_type:complete
MTKKPILTFQVEAEEEEAINRYLKKNGTPKRSPFLREAVFAWINSDQPELRKEIHEDLEAWRKEFHGVGSNLNQVAYRMNADHPLSSKQIIETLEELQDQFDRLATKFLELRNDLKL